MNVDLHSHTTTSDGQLTPTELIALAQRRQVDLLSITDHDTVAAYDLIDRSTLNGLRLIPGIELSSRWHSMGVHIVGLNINLQHAGLLTLVKRQQQARQQRAEQIADKLKRLGVDCSLPAVKALAQSENIGRPHFADYLVASGVCETPAKAFKKYLGRGKPGDIRQVWPEYAEIITAIVECGGMAVLAHPLQYKLSGGRLRQLVKDFANAGGQAMEVISGQQTPDRTRHLADLCSQHQLLASCGSDFHRTGQTWAQLGKCPPLPKQCTPVWEAWTC